MASSMTHLVGAADRPVPRDCFFLSCRRKPASRRAGENGLDSSRRKPGSRRNDGIQAIGRRSDLVVLGAWRILTVVLALTATACGADNSQPGWIVLPGMVQPIAYEAFDTHPTLGQTLRLPPAGTVPYGSQPASNPFAGVEVPKEELALGKKTFDIYCQVCHGPAGAGDGPIIGRFPNPPSLLAPRARGLSDDQLYAIVSNGQGLMPSYAVQVLERDRWRAIAYVRWLQATPGGTP